MSRLNSRWADQFPTLTFLLNKDATTEDEAWYGWIPFNDLYFDDRPGTPAYVGMVLDAAFGGSDGPVSGVRVRVMQDTSIADSDPRKIVRAGLAVEIFVDADTPALEDVPLIIYCLGLSTDAEADEDIVLPDPVSNSTVWSVKDYSGGSIASNFVQISLDGSAGDVTSALNLGTTAGRLGLFKQKNGSVLEFFSLISSGKLKITQVGDEIKLDFNITSGTAGAGKAFVLAPDGLSVGYASLGGVTAGAENLGDGFGFYKEQVNGLLRFYSLQLGPLLQRTVNEEGTEVTLSLVFDVEELTPGKLVAIDSEGAGLTLVDQVTGGGGDTLPTPSSYLGPPTAEAAEGDVHIDASGAWFRYEIDNEELQWVQKLTGRVSVLPATTDFLVGVIWDRYRVVLALDGSSPVEIFWSPDDNAWLTADTFRLDFDPTDPATYADAFPLFGASPDLLSHTAAVNTLKFSGIYLEGLSVQADIGGTPDTENYQKIQVYGSALLGEVSFQEAGSGKYGYDPIQALLGTSNRVYASIAQVGTGGDMSLDELHVALDCRLAIGGEFEPYTPPGGGGGDDDDETGSGVQSSWGVEENPGTEEGSGVTSEKWSLKATDSDNGRYWHTMVPYNGELYIFGGRDESNNVLDTLRKYNPTTDAWADLTADTGNGKWAHSAVVYNGKMYVFGGYDDTDTMVAEMRIYDFATDTWSAGTDDTGSPRSRHGACLVGDKMWIVGGRTYMASVSESYCRIYDITLDSWSTGEYLGAGITSVYGWAETYNGKIYALVASQTAPSYYVIDPAGGHTSMVGVGAEANLSQHKGWIGRAGGLIGSKLYIFGSGFISGYGYPGYYGMDGVEIRCDYDPALIFRGPRDAGSEPFRIYGAAAVLGGKLYHYGGLGKDLATWTVEHYPESSIGSPEGSGSGVDVYDTLRVYDPGAGSGDDNGEWSERLHDHVWTAQFDSSAIGNKLVFWNAGTRIPDNAVVSGLEARVYREPLNPTTNGKIYDEEVYFRKSGVREGNNLAKSAKWVRVESSEDLQPVYYGSSANQSGGNWTADEVNQELELEIVPHGYPDSFGDGATAVVYVCQFRVTYTVPEYTAYEGYNEAASAINSDGTDEGATLRSTDGDWELPELALTDPSVATILKRTGYTAGTSQHSKYLVFQDFGFSIPDGALVVGLVAEVRFNTYGYDEDVSEFNVTLLKDGTVTGSIGLTEAAYSGTVQTPWPVENDEDELGKVKYYGGVNWFSAYNAYNPAWDLPTADEINSADFGVMLYGDFLNYYGGIARVRLRAFYIT